jgi:hypothetical protein
VETKIELEFKNESDIMFDPVLQLLKQTLPPAFVLKQERQVYIEIKSDQPEDHPCLSLIDRELGRIFFSGIEISHPKKAPKYQNQITATRPKKECKLPKDLIVHAKDVSSNELKRYCAHLNLPALMRYLH